MPFSIVRSDPLFNPEAFADTLAHAEPEWRARILETLNANAWIYARNGCPDSDVRDSLAFLLRLRREFHELFSHLAPYMWHEQTTGALDIAAIEAGDVRAGYMDGRIVGTEVETPPLPDGYAALVARYFSDDEKIRAE